MFYGVKQNFRRPLLIGTNGVLVSSGKPLDTEFSDATIGAGSTGDTVFASTDPNYCIECDILYSIPFINNTVSVPLSDGTNYSFGQSFIGDGSYIRAASVTLKTDPNSTGTFLFKIYAHTGTYGSTGTPTGSPLATSAGYVSPNGGFGDDLYIVTDVFSDPFKTTSGTSYFITVEHTDPIYRVYVGIANTSMTGVGNSAYKSSAAGSWTASTTFTMGFILLGISGYSTTKYNFSNVDDYSEYIGNGGANSSFNVQSFGVLFSVTSSGNLNSFYINIDTGYYNVGNLTAKLYSVSGSLPTGSALVSSEPYELYRYVLGLPINGTTIVCFKFSTAYTLSASTTYAMVIEYGGGNVTTDVSARIGMDVSSSTYSLSSFRKLVGGTTFSTYPSTKDLPFYVFYTPLTEAMFGTYDIANGDQYNYIAATQNTKMAQSFTGIAGAFSKITVELRATGSPTGNVTASLFADDGGTFGTTGKPTGTALATSTAIAASSISTVSTQYTFTFASPYTMTAGTVYWIALEYSSGSSSNKIGVVVDISSPTASGRLAYYNGSTWAFTTYDNTGTSGATDDLCYNIYALS